jgi:hypothetical protein
LIVTVAVAGKELTDDGLMLQLPGPNVFGHFKFTFPEKPSCDAIEIGPLTPLLPALICGNAVGSLRTKSGFEVTLSVKDVISAVGAPVVVAWIVAAEVPVLLSPGTATLAVMFTGALDEGVTELEGVRVQTAFGMADVHDTVTIWLNDPAAVTLKLTGGDVLPRPTVTLAGEGLVSPNPIRCRLTGKTCVMCLESDPTACTLKL